MAVTGNLSPAEKKFLFRKKLQQEYQEDFFFTGAEGQGTAVIEKITELSRNSKGEEAAYFPLIPRLTGGGIIGDNTMHHRERQASAAWQKCNFSAFANAIVNKGALSDQKSLIQVRTIQRPVLGKWLADANEDQAVLTASGISYLYNTDGSLRVTPEGQDPWTMLDYANDVSAPSVNRHYNWNASSNSLALVADHALVSTDKSSYGLLPEMKAIAMDKRITPSRLGGRDVHVALCHTSVMSGLWKDDDFRRSVVQSGERGSNNAFLKFGHFTIHDLLIVPYSRCYNTRGAVSGTNKFGSGLNVDGSRILLMGAQALARADLGPPEWLEQKDDYGRTTGFGVQHFGGWLKPVFPSSYDNGSNEDFSIVSVDVAI